MCSLIARKFKWKIFTLSKGKFDYKNNWFVESNDIKGFAVVSLFLLCNQ